MAKILSIVIPCFNEEKTIAEILQRVEHANFRPWEKEIIVVDDGSSDTTRSILARYVGRPGYTIIMREKNGGKGAAEKDGIERASGDYIILQDADLEYNPDDIRAMLAVVEKTGAPIVFGSRNMKNPWYRASGFFGASLGVVASTWFINLLYGLSLTDAWTCYKLFSRNVARSTRFIGNGFEADYLFIGDAALKGFPIVEVPIDHVPRTAAQGKKIRYRDGIRSMWLLFLHRISGGTFFR